MYAIQAIPKASGPESQGSVTTLSAGLSVFGKLLLARKKRLMPLMTTLVLLLTSLHIDATAGDPVGYIAGELDVSGGSASYSIPIAVPPGIAGMEPLLSISYSSQSGNGLLGLGWNLGGISMIHRCGWNLAQDGSVRGVNLNRGDNYCIEGQRLVPIKGDKGNSGTVYRTELDGFSKIVSYGAAGKGPAWFKVWTKSGQVMEYGNTADSRIEASGQTTVSTWVVNKISDTTGNAIDFNYIEDKENSEFVPDVISYGPDNRVKVEFDYISAFATGISSWRSGTKFKSTKILQKLTTKVNSQVVNTWNFSYSALPSVGAQLNSVTLCSPQKCLPATSFDWLSDNTNIAFSASSFNLNNFGKDSGGWDKQHPRFFDDVNGDGKTDVVGFGNKGVYVSLSNGVGLDPSTKWVAAYGKDTGGWVNEKHPRMMADVNGDGLPDVVGFASSGVDVSLSTGSNFTAPKRWSSSYGRNTDCFNFVYKGGKCRGWSESYSGYSFANTIRTLADVNGDGLADIVGFATSGIYISLSTGSKFSAPQKWNDKFGTNTGDWGLSSEPRMLADVNGDGLPDVVGFALEGVRVSLSNGEKFAHSQLWLKSFGTNAGGWRANHPRMMADVNGDGLDDVVGFGSSGVSVSISTGSALSSPKNWTQQFGYKNCSGGSGSFGSINKVICELGNWSSEKHIRMMSDINSDGLADIVAFGSNGVYIAKSTGKGFAAAQKVSSSFGYNAGWRFGTHPRSLADFDGDGALDIAGFANSGVRSIKANFTTNRVISAIRLGTEQPTLIRYKPLTDAGTYTKGNTATSSQLDIQNAAYVVSEVVSDNGIGGTRKTTYRYGGAKADRTGRGYLGFAWIEETDQSTGTKVRTDLHQQFPFIGMPKRIRTWLGDETLISDSQTSYSDRTSANGKVHFIYAATSTERSYDRDGSLVSTVTTANSKFDDYGNLGQIEVTTTAGNETYRKVTSNTYKNNAVKWHLGRLTDAYVMHYHTDGSSLTRHSRFGYDFKTGLIKTEIIEPQTPLSLLTAYTYDKFGNKTSATLRAPGVIERKTTTTYDANGQFPIETTNALDHSETRVIDPRYGNIISRTGPNDLTTSYAFDSFGNAIGKTRADGNSSRVENLWASDCPNTVPGATYCVVSENDGSAPVEKYFDNLNRSIRTISMGFDGRKVFTDTVYNRLGQVAKVSRPYYEGDSKVWGSSEYDNMGRVIRTTEPGPNNTTKVSSTAYNGLTTVVTNPAGQQKTTVTNALGNLVSVQEPEGASLSYRYDALGNLLETEDNQGNITRLNYDLRGRKTRMDDPDMGIWHYKYNGFDELLRQTDAKGKITTMTYDLLGRLIQRKEVEGRSKWIYDSAANGIGKLTQVTGPDGYKKTLSYDNLGRPHINTTTADKRTLSVTSEYDEFSRLKIQHRPQGFITENVYTANGHLESVRSPKSAVADPAYVAQLTQLLERQAALLTQAEGYRDQATAYKAQAVEYRAIVQVLIENSDIQASVNLANAAARLERAAVNLRGASIKSEAYANTIRKVLLNISTSKEAEIEEALSLALTNNRQQAAKFISAVTRGLNQAEALIAIAPTDSEAQTELSTVLGQLDTQVNELENLQVQLQRIETESLPLVQDFADHQASGSEYVYFWRAKAHDASGRLLEELYGNGLSSQYTYDNSNGLMTSQRSGFLYNEDIRHLTYQYDQLNNVTQRADLVGDVQESFGYDGLDRLTRSTVTSQLQDQSYNRSVTYEYDTLGNITYKSDVGLYLYGAGSDDGAGPHAVTAAGNKSYNYDANGNMTSGGGRSIQWSSFNKPLQVSKDNKTVGFSYAPNRARYLKTGSDGSRTLYLGKLYEQITKGQEVTHKQFIYAGGSLVAIHNSGLDSLGAPKADQTRYMHKDNLGSIDTITDSVGNVVERMSFDPFGQRRQNNWRDNTTGISLIPLLTNRGFTGHEHLDDVGLIHMNGRVYDAELGRFLSADPTMQFPYKTQGFNRYSYVQNNPLKYTDPSGYWSWNPFKAVKKIFRAGRRLVRKVKTAIIKAVGPDIANFAATVGSAFCGPFASLCYASAQYDIARAYGASPGDAFKSAAKAGVMHYVGGAAAKGVGSTFNFNTNPVGNVIGNGVVGGALSKAQGGSFKDGFLGSAFAASLKNVNADYWGTGSEHKVHRVITAGVIGGTASVIGGGKFANGAASAAFTQMYNAENHIGLRDKFNPDGSRKEGVDLLFGGRSKADVLENVEQINMVRDRLGTVAVASCNPSGCINPISLTAGAVGAVLQVEVASQSMLVGAYSPKDFAYDAASSMVGPIPSKVIGTYQQLEGAYELFKPAKLGGIGHDR